MNYREAHEGDADALRTFCCTGETFGAERDVEIAVQSCLEWASEDSARHVAVIEERDVIVSVCCYRPLLAYEPDAGFFVEYVASSLLARDGSNRGTLILVTTLAKMAELLPDTRAAWIVHDENRRGHALSAAVGARSVPWTDTPEGYTNYIVTL